MARIPLGYEGGKSQAELLAIIRKDLMKAGVLGLFTSPPVKIETRCPHCGQVFKPYEAISIPSFKRGEEE